MLEEHLKTPLAPWMSGKGDASDVVVSSRIRLARNLEGHYFPGHLGGVMAQGVIDRIATLTASIPSMEFVSMEELTPVDRWVLVEKHLISPQHAREPAHKALLLEESERVSVMVNEEDHLRIQSIQAGLDLRSAYTQASMVDDALEDHMDFAFSAEVGYLTACPTNVGTGLRASVMMHLPGLVMVNRVGRVLNALPKLGLTVRGLYGEGTEALGNLFQISNQITLGMSEEEILEGLVRVAAQVIEQERSARAYLLHQHRYSLLDRIGRAYGLLQGAHLLGGEEAMRFLSDLRLGVEMGLLTDIPLPVVNELLVLTRPGYLQRLAGRELEASERDVARAKAVREWLAAVTGERNLPEGGM